MRYIYFILFIIILETINIFGYFWYWVIRKHRHRARLVVYNYVLEHNIYIHHLHNANYKRMNIKDTWECDTGMIPIIHVNYLTYLYWKWLVWIWLDDTADVDVYKRVTNDDKKSLFFNKLLEEQSNVIDSNNSFEYGNYSTTTNSVKLFSEINFMLFDKVTNFQHMYEYTTDTNRIFFFNKIHIGWKRIGSIKQNHSVYKLYLYNH